MDDQQQIQPGMVIRFDQQDLVRIALLCLAVSTIGTLLALYLAKHD